MSPRTSHDNLAVQGTVSPIGFEAPRVLPVIEAGALQRIPDHIAGYCFGANGDGIRVDEQIMTEIHRRREPEGAALLRATCLAISAETETVI